MKSHSGMEEIMWLQLSVGKINIFLPTIPLFFFFEKYRAKAGRILKGIKTYTQTLPCVNAAFNKLFHLRGKICHYR